MRDRFSDGGLFQSNLPLGTDLALGKPWAVIMESAGQQLQNQVLLALELARPGLTCSACLGLVPGVV